MLQGANGSLLSSVFFWYRRIVHHPWSAPAYGFFTPPVVGIFFQPLLPLSPSQPLEPVKSSIECVEGFLNLTNSKFEDINRNTPHKIQNFRP